MGTRLSIKKALWVLVLILIAIAGCRVTNGGFAALVGFATIISITKRRYGVAGVGIGILALLQVTTSALIGAGFHMLIVKLMFCLIAPVFLMVPRLKRPSMLVLPLGGLFVYLIYMVLPSALGWFPMISYLKIALVLAYLSALYFCAKAAQYDITEMEWLRAGLLAICMFVILGSLVTIAMPSVGYSMQISKLQMWDANATAMDIGQKAGSVSLFSGVLFHSQCLAPIVAIAVGCVLCDMLFVEKKLRLLHLITIGASPVLLYMTRSRTGLVALFVELMFLWIWGIHRAPISHKIRRIVGSTMSVLIGLLAIALIVLQIRQGTLTKWINKSEDSRAEVTVESVMFSRMGKVEQNLDEFKENPVIGKGFQTSPLHPVMYQQGLITIFSAPIEKSIVPLVVLAEGGVIGAVIFLTFFVTFCVQCFRRRQLALLTIFLGMMASNLSEATCFSVSGTGGLLWALTLFGGLAVDYWTKVFNSQVKQGDFTLQGG